MSYAVRAKGTVLVFIGLLLAAFCMVPAITTPGVSASQGVTLYLPVVHKTWPPVPGQPALLPIENADGDGRYAVSWSVVVRADDYVLEEKWQAQDWFTAYLGSATHVDLTNRPAGQYAYRCRGRCTAPVCARTLRLNNRLLRIAGLILQPQLAEMSF